MTEQSHTVLSASDEPPVAGCSALVRSATRVSEPLLRIERLTVEYPHRPGLFGLGNASARVVDGVSVQVEAGTTLGLVGESGCGKSSLARAVVRLTRPSAGRVWLCGVDVWQASGAELASLRRNVQMVFQDPYGSLDPRMRVGAIVEEPLQLQRTATRGERRQTVLELLDRVGLASSFAERYPHELSGGQRQRVGIARAIALRPRLVVCDEAVSALDLSVQSQILNLLSDLQREFGLAYLFISHNLSVVAHVSDAVAVMYLGRIVEYGPARDVCERPRHPYTLALVAAGRVGDGVPIAVGEPPDAADPPAGCAFHPRCAFATDRCKHERPELQSAAADGAARLVACHLADEVSVGPGDGGGPAKGTSG